MFCPNCGKGEQTPDAYCRNCGIFLTGFSGDTSVLSKIFGANTPEKQLNAGLAFDVLTLIFSLLLLFFLIGYYDGRYAKTGETTPPVIYLVYVFLGLVALWQALSLLVGIRHKSKLSNRKKDAALTSVGATDVLPEATKDYLPPAEAANFVSPSTTEETTRNLNRAPRK